jgi:pentatricopeptide repeat protein
MVERGLVPNKVTFNELLAAKISAKDRRGLWEVIEMMRLAKIAPNSFTCSTLLKALTEHSHANDVSRTIELLDQMEEAMDEVLFGAAAETCVRIRRLDLLTELRRKYVKGDTPLALTSPAYGSMIKAYGRVGDVEQLWELWNEMCELKLNPTAITVGCMVDALVKNDSVEGAWRLMHEILEDEERRASVNTVIYSTILKGFASTKQISKVFMVYKEMKERSVPLNTITFNTLLDACARGRAMDRVPQLLEDMKASSVEPDIITYSTIIKGYCMNGDVDRAFDVLEDMRREKVFAPDEILYNSLLDGCVRQNRVEQALQLVQDMKDSGTAPSNYTLSILIKLLGRSRQLKQAFDLVEKLCSENGLRPNVQVYTCLMQACIQNRKLDRALEVHNTMILESGCQPDQMVYTVLARGCLQSGAMEQALKVIRCAYRLPGHDLATTSDRTTPPGIEAKLLADIPSHIASSNEASKAPWQTLAADLKEHRGVVLALGNASRRSQWRS